MGGREGGKHHQLVEEMRRDGHSPNHYLGHPNMYFELSLIAYKLSLIGEKILTLKNISLGASCHHVVSSVWEGRQEGRQPLLMPLSLPYHAGIPSLTVEAYSPSRI